MGYSEALHAAGATVHAYNQFGSYQGDWWAKVTLPDGRQGFINGRYGSCSGCDAFESEIGYSSEQCDTHSYGPEQPECAECQQAKAAAAEKLAKFGAGYLDSFLTADEALAKASENLEWDTDAQEMVDWIRANG